MVTVSALGHTHRSSEPEVPGERKFEMIDSAPATAHVKFDRMRARFYARDARDAVRRSELPRSELLGRYRPPSKFLRSLCALG